MKVINFKKLIALIFTMCALLGSANFAYAKGESEEEIKPELKIVYPVTSEKFDTHVPETPQWDDELKAEVTYDKEKIKEEPVITWFRFNNKPKYNEQGEKVADTYYEEIGEGETYRITAEDIHHMIKVETAVGGTHLIVETKPVERKNYGKVRLQVVDNTNYGDTDGYVGLLDTRMQYTCDDVTICDVAKDGAILNSGATLENLNPNGFTWKVRYKGTTLVEESEWETFTIQAGKKEPLESIELNLISRTLTPDEPIYQLKMTYSPENAYIGSVTYKSSDANVATVTENGLITAINNGEATISVTVNGVDNELSQECAITVKKFDTINEVNVLEENISLALKDNEKVQLKSEIYPKTAINYIEQWRSSDENICKVSDTGVVSCVNPGNAMVTYTVIQGDKQVMDTVDVEVKQIPSVTSPSDWKRGSGKDLSFDFVGCTPDENTVVIIQSEDGRHEIVSNIYYIIENNRITIKYDYLMSFNAGNVSFNFTFPDLESKQTTEEKICIDEVQNSSEKIDSDAIEETVQIPVITSASSNSLGQSKKFALVKVSNYVGQKLFSKVSDENTNGNIPTFLLTQTVTITSEDIDNKSFTPGNTFATIEYKLPSGSLGSTDTFEFEKSSDFDIYYTIADKQDITGSSNEIIGIRFILESNGNNTPVVDFSRSDIITLKLYQKGNSGEKYLHTWKLKSENFYDSLSLSITSSAQINPDSQSKCIIEPYLSGATLDDKFLEGYEISFVEVNDSNSDRPYSGEAKYLVKDSLKLNSDKKCVAVANRDGTGYVRAFLKLRMIEKDNPIERQALELCKSNTCEVKIKLYELILKKNIKHQWNQNSIVNLDYYIQGDFNKFLSDWGGKFTDNNFWVYYVKDAKGEPQRLSFKNDCIKVEQIGDNVLKLSLNYYFLRRLHLGTYPLYIAFKCDGLVINVNTISKNCNISTYFQVIKAGIPITGDEFNSMIWIGLSAITLPLAGILSYALLKKKKTKTVNGTHQK